MASLCAIMLGIMGCVGIIGCMGMVESVVVGTCKGNVVIGSGTDKDMLEMERVLGANLHTGVICCWVVYTGVVVGTGTDKGMLEMERVLGANLRLRWQQRNLNDSSSIRERWQHQENRVSDDSSSKSVLQRVQCESPHYELLLRHMITKHSFL